MGVNITGGFKDATVVDFISLNPLFSGMKFPLEVYKVLVEDLDECGNKLGEHEETCVTHASLLQNYNIQLLPIGVTKNFSNITPVSYNGVIFKCTLEMTVSLLQSRELIQKGIMAPMENYKVHIESTGGATLENCNSLIAKNHLAETAENRSFDRAMIQFLALDMSEYGNRTLYGSSELEGKRVTVPMPAPPKVSECRPMPTPVVKANPAEKPDTNSLPSWCNAAPKETPTAPAPVAQAVQNEAPVTPANTSDTGKKPDEFADERIAASKVRYTDEEYRIMLNHPLGGMANAMSGKPIGEVFDLMTRSKDKAALNAIKYYITFKPYQTDQIPIWKTLISYLTKENYLQIFTKSKKFYLHDTPMK